MDHFIGHLEVPIRLAYLLRPPQTYQTKLDYSVQHGMDQLKEMLNFPLYKEKRINGHIVYETKDKVHTTSIPQPDSPDYLPPEHPDAPKPVMVPDLQVANLILRVVDKLDTRKFGSPTQRVHMQSTTRSYQQNVNINHTLTSGQYNNDQTHEEAFDVMAQLERKLQLLEPTEDYREPEL